MLKLVNYDMYNDLFFSDGDLTSCLSISDVYRYIMHDGILASNIYHISRYIAPSIRFCQNH